MARAAEEHVKSSITHDVSEGEKQTPLLRPLHELKREELVVICQNLEQSLRNRDRQIDEINKHCEDMMRLYYETIETLAARNKELHLLQDQLKQYEELTRCQDELRQREHGDNSRQSTPKEDQTDYDSASLTSGNTDPELACLPNEEDDNEYAEDGDDDDNNDEEGEDNDSDDAGDGGEDDDHDGNGDDRSGADGYCRATDEVRTDKQTDASDNSSDGFALAAATSMTTPVYSSSTASKRSDGSTMKSDSKLSLSLAVDSHGKPARPGGHRQASKLPVPNAAARARRHSKYLAISCQNLNEKVHPVLHRRDPNKSLYDVMIAELASVHSNETAAAAMKNPRGEDGELPEIRNCEIESWKPDLALDRTTPPPDMKELFSDEEADLVETNCEKTEGVNELESSPSGECSGDKAQSSTSNDTQTVLQNNDDGIADKDETPVPSTIDSLTENDRFKLNQTGESVASSSAIRRSNPTVCSKSLETNSFCSRMETCPLANSIQVPQVKPVPSPRSTLLKENTENMRTLYKPILSAEPVYSKTSPRTVSSTGSAVSPHISRDFIHNNNTNCMSYTVVIGQSVDKDSLEYVTSHK